MFELYNNWKIENMKNPNKSYYEHWIDDATYVMGAYDKETGIGVERRLTIDDEYEINITKDADKYQE